MTNPEQYQPKGGMCANCTKMKNDCSHLDFEKMRVLQRDTYADKNVFIVLCGEFERKIDTQLRRKVERGNGNCMALDRGGKHFIGDKVGQKLRRLPTSAEVARLIAAQNDREFSADVKRRLDAAELNANPKLHISKAES